MRTRIACLLLPLLLPLLLAAACHAQRPLAHWSFDETAGAVARDTSGNGHDGTIHGASFSEGRFGGALHFDGRDDYVEVPASPSLEAEDALTLEAWAKLEGLGQTQDRVVLARSDHPLAYGGWGLTWGYGTDFLWGQDGDYRPLTHVPQAAWTHLVLVSSLRGYRVALYVNGVQQCSSLWGKPRVPSRYPLLIGRRGEGHYFSGWLDEISLYDGALTPEQVAARYRGEPLPAATAAEATASRPLPPAPRGPLGERVQLLGAWESPATARATPAVYRNLFIAFTNRGPQPLTTGAVWLGGAYAAGEGAAVAGATTDFIFAGTSPATVAPGGAGVLNLKLLRGAALPPALSLTLQEQGGQAFDAEVSFAVAPVSFEALAFDEDLRGAWVYLRADEPCRVQGLTVAGAEVQARQSPTGSTAAGSGDLLPLRLEFSAPLRSGTPLVITAATDRGPAHAFVRAFAADFPVGMYRVQRERVAPDYVPPAGREWLAEYRGTFASGTGTGQAPREWLQDCRRHFIDTLAPDYLDRGGDPRLAGEYGLKVVPYGGNVAVHRNSPAISAWYYADEPGREGLARALAGIETLRVADPARPIIVTINPPVWPRGIDFDSVDVGYQDTYPVPGGALDEIAANVAAYRKLLAPKPVCFIPQCFRRAPGLTAGWSRFPTPEEERFMVLMSLAAGARGEIYFAYNVEPHEPIEGCGVSKASEARALWEEIGRINLELRTLAPLLAQSCVLDTARSGKAEIARLAAGRETLLAVVLNHDYEYTKETFRSRPQHDVTLPLALPAWLKPAEAFAVTADGPRDVRYSEGKLRLPRLNCGAVVVLTADAALRQKLETRRKALVAEAER